MAIGVVTARPGDIIWIDGWGGVIGILLITKMVTLP